MTIKWQVLGEPNGDNCLFVRVDSGQSLDRILFDCGARCLTHLSVSEIQSIDHLLFSHLHMDHVAGFDDFFRCNYARDTKPNRLWGPDGSAEILQHRMQGYWWNLCDGKPGHWQVCDITSNATRSTEFSLADGFRTPIAQEPAVRSAPLIETPDWTLDCIELKHHGPCLGYLLREKPKSNVDLDSLAEMNLKPGSWLQVLKSDAADSDCIDVDGNPWSLGERRARLLQTRDGESIAYVTDFLLDDETHAQLTEWLRGVDTLVCEAQYRFDDLEHAQKNHHATTRQVAKLASDAQVGRLTLFHLSDRYNGPQWREMLAEAKSEFENTQFPEHWQID